MATNIPPKHLNVLRIPDVLTTIEIPVVIPDVKTLRYFRLETDSTNGCRWSRTPGGTFSTDNYGVFRRDAGRMELRDIELQPLDAVGTFLYVRAETATVQVEVVYME